MYTLCPHCDSVHLLSASQLAGAGGKVRCARCEKPFNALDHLFDDYPDKGRKAEKAQDGELPEVGRKPIPNFPAEPLEPPVQAQALRWPWAIALLLLVLTTAVNLTWTFREAIPPDSKTARLMHDLGLPGFEPPAPYRDPGKIHLLARDIHTHPTRPGVLVLSAAFVNLATQSQPYPTVTVNLKNADDQTLAARRFEPVDYLLEPPAPDAQLAPDQQVALLLEFADPGELASGFEIHFH